MLFFFLIFCLAFLLFFVLSLRLRVCCCCRGGDGGERGPFGPGNNARPGTGSFPSPPPPSALPALPCPLSSRGISVNFWIPFSSWSAAFFFYFFGVRSKYFASLSLDTHLPDLPPALEGLPSVGEKDSRQLVERETHLTPPSCLCLVTHFMETEPSGTELTELDWTWGAYWQNAGKIIKKG